MSERKATLTCSGRMWFNINQSHYLGPNRVALIEHIAELGSISKAAKAMGMSYKAAWDTLQAMDHLAGEPLVTRVSGGKGGGGTRVTEYGIKLIRYFRRVEEMYHRYLTELNDQLNSEFNLPGPLVRPRPRSSPPNQFAGKVTGVRRAGGWVEVKVGVEGYGDLAARFFAGGGPLPFKAGREVVGVIKPSSVEVLAADRAGTVLAPNQFPGVVERVTEGAIDARVIVRLDAGGQLVGIQTMGSSRELGLAVGQRVIGLFGSEDVILALPPE